MKSPLLIEIGCEEIPSRMIEAAAADLEGRILRILEQGRMEHGASRNLGGSRRLAVIVDEVQTRQEDREEQVLGPPAKIAFDESGAPSKAAVGFARKQGIDPSELRKVENDKGAYAAFDRKVIGLDIGDLLARELPGAVAGMSFPKTMRWAEGTHRWVRPVHWLVALHGDRTLPLELFGVRAGNRSRGHRFLGERDVEVKVAGDYESALESVFVVALPSRRRETLEQRLAAGAESLGGRIVEDPDLLDEIADLAEWPAVVAGGFEADFLALPKEILVTTLRYHQKCFSVQDGAGKLLPGFLAVANTDRDPSGHIRRGNEWVVSGRLEDARFFWAEDRKRSLEEHGRRLEQVVFHAKIGTYAEKAERVSGLAASLAQAAGLDQRAAEICGKAARLCKNDLVTGTVGEFPELQGVVGGLLLREEGEPEALCSAVYEHYRPQGPEDDLPDSPEGAVVAVADKLDTSVRLVAAGEVPSGSRDPFGLRRATSGIYRIAIERGWPISLTDLNRLAGGNEATLSFLAERLRSYLRESGWAVNEVRAVLPEEGDEASSCTLPDIAERLGAIQTVRSREDFARLVELTKRVDNILVKSEGENSPPEGWEEPDETARALARALERGEAELGGLIDKRDYAGVIDGLAAFAAPVDLFFEKVLVNDPDDPASSSGRKAMLGRLRSLLIRCFDIRELAGQAERRD